MSIVTGRRLDLFFQEISKVFLDINGKAVSAAKADSATQDSSGNIITATYAKKNVYDDTTMSLGRNRRGTVGAFSVVAGGQDNTASGTESAVVGGRYGNVSGISSVIIGGGVKVEGDEATVGEDMGNKISGHSSVIIGGYKNNILEDDNHSAIIGGCGCTSQCNAVIMGHYNDITKGTEATYNEGTGTGTAFEIGNGTESAASNAVRMDYNGKIWCKAAYSASGADYAELFEWLDGNPDSEDRRGYFVTMDGDKIRKAEPGEWILGIVSASPIILGNSDMEWQGQFMRDEFGAYIIEHHCETITENEPVLDDDGNPVTDEETGEVITHEEVEKLVEYDFYKINPDYNPEEQYIDRMSRPEWDAVGMMGVLPVWDDGTCEVNGYCTVAPGGIATGSRYGYRVVDRVNDHIVKVILNCETDTIHENKIAELEDRISMLEKMIY